MSPHTNSSEWLHPPYKAVLRTPGVDSVPPSGFLPLLRSGAQVPRQPAGTALLGTSGVSAPGKDSAAWRRKQQTKPGPFSFSAGPWERHRGPAEWSDLEKVKQASEVVQRHQGRGAERAGKEILYIKALFSLSSGADTRH